MPSKQLLLSWHSFGFSWVPRVSSSGIHAVLGLSPSCWMLAVESRVPNNMHFFRAKIRQSNELATFMTLKMAKTSYEVKWGCAWWYRHIPISEIECLTLFSQDQTKTAARRQRPRNPWKQDSEDLRWQVRWPFLAFHAESLKEPFAIVYARKPSRQVRILSR